MGRLGTNAGLKRMCSGGTEDRYADLQYIRRRYVTKEQLRAAIARVCDLFASISAVTGKVELVYKGEQEGIALSRSSVRRILAAAGISSPRQRRPANGGGRAVG